MLVEAVNNSGHRGVEWDNQPLGQMSDVQLASQVGVSSGAVRKARLKRGIPTYHSQRWDAVGIGSAPDKEMAGFLGVSRRTVSRVRQQRGLHGPLTIEWDKQPLGKITDTALARVLGVGQSVVSSARRLRGIPRADLLCRTAEGEPATYPEALIDLYWHEQGIPHEFQVKIGPYIADWVLDGGLVVEYAGFKNHRKLGTLYWERLTKKVKFYRGLGREVQVLTEPDLDFYDFGQVPIFEGRRSTCAACAGQFGVDQETSGVIKKHHAKGMCRSCYRRSTR